MKKIVLQLKMTTLILIGNAYSYGAVVQPGETIGVDVSAICFTASPFNDIKPIQYVIGNVMSTHDMDSARLWLVTVPGHQTITHMTEAGEAYTSSIPSNPYASRVFLREEFDPMFQFDSEIYSHILGKWHFWFTGTNGQEFYGEKTAGFASTIRRMTIEDVGFFNKNVIASGGIDTLTAADTADYEVVELSGTFEFVMPTEIVGGDSVSCFVDSDGDGYGDPNNQVTLYDTNTCTTGYSDNSADCNDGDATIHMLAFDGCDGIDNNCNGIIDEGCPPTRKGIFSPQDPIIVGESPNPFDDRVTINYSILENNTKIEMQVFDVAGRLVTDLVKETKSSGDYRVEWTPESKVTFGVYHLKVNITSSTGEVQTINRKLIYNR